MESKSNSWVQIVASKEVGVVWLGLVSWYAIALVIPQPSVLFVVGEPIFALAFPAAILFEIIGIWTIAILINFYFISLPLAAIARWSNAFDIDAWRSILLKKQG